MRWALSLWLAIGILYAGTTMYSELLWKYAKGLVDEASAVATLDREHATPIIVTSFAKAFELSEQMITFTPEIWWLRSTRARHSLDDISLSDEQAIEAIKAELKYDPYEPKYITFLALRLRHAGRLEEAREYIKYAHDIWGDSPITVFLDGILNPRLPEVSSPPEPSVPEVLEADPSAGGAKTYRQP